MRDRLLAAFLALTGLTVLLYGVPRSFVRAGVVHDQAQRQVEVVARAAATVVATRREAGLPLSDADVELFDERDRVVLQVAQQELVLAGAGSPRTGGVSATSPVRGGGTVVVRRPDAVVREAVRHELAPIALTGLVSLVLAGAAAVLMARRMARPFQLLAEHAEQLGGSAGAGAPLETLRVPEAEAIAAALRASAARLEASLRQERAFARNVSHQLRTPLTGVRLRVEGALLSGEVGPEAQEDLEEALTEVDRLASTVSALLAFSRREDTGGVQSLPAGEVLEAAARRWQPLVEAQQRVLQVRRPAEDEPVEVAVGVVEQVLDVLVHNALVHGTGTITLALRRGPGAVDLVVSDEGTGLSAVPDAELFARREAAREGSEGVGLRLCRELAEVVGAELVVLERQPTAFALRLRR